MIVSPAALPQDSPPVAPDLVTDFLDADDLEMWARTVRRDWAKFACRSQAMPEPERRTAARARLRLYFDAIDDALEAGAEDAARMMRETRRRGW